MNWFLKSLSFILTNSYFNIGDDAQDGNYVITITSDKTTFTKTIRLNTATVQTRSLDIY